MNSTLLKYDLNNTGAKIDSLRTPDLTITQCDTKFSAPVL